MIAERVFLMIIKQLSIFVENKRGRLAEITGLLHEAQIDIRALCIADTKNFGILRLIVETRTRRKRCSRKTTALFL